MAHEVIYKHPSESLDIAVDFDEDLPDDSGLATTSSIASTDSAGVAATIAAKTTSTTSTTMIITLTGGINPEDYNVLAVGVGQTTAKKAVRLLNVRVRNDHGIGIF